MTIKVKTITGETGTIENLKGKEPLEKIKDLREVMQHPAEFTVMDGNKVHSRYEITEEDALCKVLNNPKDVRNLKKEFIDWV